MAIRPVYSAKITTPFYETEDIDFEFFNGFSVAQKQRSIQSLHTAFKQKHPDSHILEVSSKSMEELGVKLSAFNLTLHHGNLVLSVESAFQGSKVFDGNLQYMDLYRKNSHDAKKDPRIRNSGKLVKFCFFDDDFPLNPTNFFYNWLYAKALYEHDDYIEELKKYNTFTDIEFNPKRSWNCQAMAVAIFQGLNDAGLLDIAMESSDSYRQIVYGESTDYHQMSMFDLMK